MTRTATEAADQWARTWERGWSELDVEAIVALYADDVVLSTHPFRAPYRGRAGVREYVGRVFGEESEVRARFAAPIVGENAAAVPWWASYVEAGQPVTLAGTSLLRFDADGLVTSQWDTWHQAEGRVDPSGEPFRPTEGR